MYSAINKFLVLFKKGYYGKMHVVGNIAINNKVKWS